MDLGMKRYYDIGTTESKLEVGDAVWLYNPQRKKGLSPKLQKPWQGPYVIIKRINDLIYRIQLGPRAKADHNWSKKACSPVMMVLSSWRHV